MIPFKIARFLIAMFVFLYSSTFAQQRAQTDKALAQLADHYNTGHYLGIYNQFSTQSKAIVGAEYIINFYKNNILPPLGLMKSWKYLDERKTDANYIVSFERGKLGLRIAASSDNHITFLDWYPLKPEKQIANPRNTALIKTNNPKQTKLQLYLDTLALDYLKDPNNSSLSIGLIKGSTKEYYFYGETNKTTHTLPDEKSIYEIGSISKTFTAVLLAHAVNEKKISLNDDIRKYLPGTYPDLQFNGKAITVLNLANHTSGLPLAPEDLTSSPAFNALNPYAHYTKDMILKYIKNLKLRTSPGGNPQYSNLGFALLGIMLENIYKQPLTVLLKKSITGPLKMNSTNFNIPEAEKNLATTGYSDENGEVLPNWQMGAFNSAGGLNSNLQDMLLYLQANMSGVNPDFLLSHKETNLQAEFSRGLAWLLEPLRGQTSIYHSGGTGGFRAWCGFIKDKKAGVVVLSNSSEDTDHIAQELLAFLAENQTLK